MDACRLAACVSQQGWAGGTVALEATMGAWPCGSAVCRLPVAPTSANAPPPTASSAMTVTRSAAASARGPAALLADGTKAPLIRAQ